MNINIVQNHHLQVSWRKSAVFEGHCLMLETRRSSNLVNILNSVYYLKEYCLPLSVFLDEQHHFCVESPHSSEWEKNCSSCKRRINFINKTLLHLVRHCELCSFSKERWLTFRVLMCEEHEHCAKSPHTSEWEKNCSFWKRFLNIREKRVQQHG
jgi:hypothetical protein